MVAGGSLPRGNLTGEDSDSSEDLEEKMQKVYTELSLNKTNTIPIG